jgi:predicted dehydrogenase
MPLPTGLHHEWIMKTLTAGKHILAEKTLANTLLSAQEMIQQAQKNDLLLIENFQFQFHSQHQYIKNLINSGEIGEVRQIRAAFGFPLMHGDNFRYRKADGGGALLDTGAYMAKIAQFLLGNTAHTTAAHFWHSTEFGIDMGGSATFQNDNGITAQTTWGFDNFYQCNYEIWGSKGKITAERAYTAAPNVQPKIIVEKQGTKDEIILDSDNHFINILTHFAQCITNKQNAEELQKLTHQAQLLHQMQAIAGYQVAN